MLTDEEVKKKSERVIELEEEYELLLLLLIMERINDLEDQTITELYSLNQLIRTTNDLKDIERLTNKFTKLQEKAVSDILADVAYDSYNDTQHYYELNNKQFIPLEYNTVVRNSVSNVVAQTRLNVRQLFDTQAFMLRDPNNPKQLIPTSLSDTYKEVVNQGIHSSSAAQKGGVDYHTAMKSTIKSLVDKGVVNAQYEAESGRVITQTLESAVHRNILDGIKQINQEIQNETGKQFGANGVELSVHMNPAPDHAPVQGHQFTMEQFNRMQTGQDFYDVDGKHYEGFDRPIGMWNCRHFAYNIIIGEATQNYSNELLDQIVQNNEKGVVLPNGTHLTLYEVMQKQREIENKIRHLKVAQKAAERSGDTTLSDYYTGRVSKQYEMYYEFCKNCNIKPRINRTQIYSS